MSNVKAFFSKSGRFLFLSLLFIVTLCFAMFEGDFVSWFLFFVITPFLTYSFIFLCVPEQILVVERIIEPTRLEAGSDVTVKVKFKRKTIFPFVYVTIDERFGKATMYKKVRGELRSLKLVGFKKEFELTYLLASLPRGEHLFKGLEVTFHDFLGWSNKKIVVQKEQVIIVYPRLHEMKYVSMHTQFDIGTMASRFSIVKDTSMATGIRDYQAGDRFSWIHWKSFAKTQTLRTKEFEDRQSQELYVCLDRSSSKNFDSVVELTASIIQTIIKKQGDISLLSVGEKRTYFSRIQGSNQFERVMYHLATVDSDYKRSIESLFLQEKTVTSDATILFVTSEMTEEKLLALTKVINHCICFVVSDDPLAIAPFKDKVPNIRLAHISKDNYLNAFAEVQQS